MIALATCIPAHLPAEDVDRQPLEAAFAARGTGLAEFVEWDDASVDWASYQAVVLRSTWDYSIRLPEFQRWLGEVSEATRLLNPAGTVAWNLDKAYLAALRDGGVPVVATGYLNNLPKFDAALAELSAGQIVVKPTVSAGSQHTGRFDRADPAARELAGRIVDLGKQVMLQPYYASVGRQGEVSVVHFDGSFSHAFRKGPILELGGSFLGGGYEEVVEPVTPSEALLAAAESALACYRDLVGTDPVLAGTEPLLYSRVDLIDDDEGRPLCLELELIEPSLYLSTDEKAAGRFIDAIQRRL